MLPANFRFHRYSVWCGLIFSILFFAALLMAGFFPPPPPTMTGEEIIALAQGRIFYVKLAVIIGILAAGLSIPFNVVIAVHIARIEKQDGGLPILATMSFGGGLLNSMLIMWPFLFWAGMFYRPDSDPQVIQTLFDLTWLEFVMAGSPAILQMLVIAFAGFIDKSDNRIFPRWSCYLMLWAATFSYVGSISIYFYEGPFTWRGLISLGMPVIGFAIWMFTLLYVMLRYLKVEEQLNGRTV